MRLYLLSYADKELTNLLVLASDWLSNISNNEQQNSSPFTNPDSNSGLVTDSLVLFTSEFFWKTPEYARQSPRAIASNFLRGAKLFLLPPRNKCC